MIDPLEAARLKQSIDLRAVAMSCGFRELPGDRWHGDKALRRGKGERIYITRQPWGDCFWQPSSGAKGSAVDFLKVFEGMSIKDAINELRQWNGNPTFTSAAREIAVPLKDRAAVQEHLAGMRVALTHPYLQADRAIPIIALQHWRFRGRVLIDRYNNAVFPHFDEQGICGAELKNRRFTGFISGGERGLHLSRQHVNDNAILFGETGIDNMSHFILTDDPWTRYASTGGAISDKQRVLIRLQIEKLPEGGTVIGGNDNDAAGRKNNAVVYRAFKEAGRKLTYREDVPRRKDFNMDLVLRELVPA